jgi:hypothetical protein
VGQDLIDLLIAQGYIKLYQRPKKTEEIDSEDEMYFISRSGRRFSYGDLKRGFKKIPYLYLITNKLRTLRQIKLLDDEMTVWIDKHLHLLNDQYFNHYNHSYKYIKVLPPSRNAFLQFDQDERYIIPLWGLEGEKNYYPDASGYDENSWAGSHINLFTFKKDLIHFTTLVQPIEIGLKNSQCIILADQLLRTYDFNITDESETVIENNFEIVIKKGRRKRINKKKPVKRVNDYSAFFLKSRFKNPLFNHPNDYDLTKEIFHQQLMTALFGYFHISEFASRFPQAAEILRSIKGGGRGSEKAFRGFADNIKPTIYKTDYRLVLEDKHPALSEGQAYYKIVSLVCRIREVELMRAIWKRLKKCGIVFIPLLSSVVVSDDEKIATSYIVRDEIRKHFDKRLMVEVVEKDL